MDKNKNYKILACCGCGNGTCQMLAMTIRKVCKKLDVTAIVEPAPASVGISQSSNYDVIVCNQGLVSSFKKAQENGTPVIGLKNIMSEAEISDKFNKYL